MLSADSKDRLGVRGMTALETLPTGAELSEGDDAQKEKKKKKQKASPKN